MGLKKLIDFEFEVKKVDVLMINKTYVAFNYYLKFLNKNKLNIFLHGKDAAATGKNFFLRIDLNQKKVKKI